MKERLSEKDITIFQFLFLDKDTLSIEDFLLKIGSVIELSQEEISEINDLVQFKKTDYTKNQHYVQKGYLKKFVNSETGKLIALDLKSHRVKKEQSIRSACSDTYFYSMQEGKEDVMSQVVEKYLGKYEDYFIKIYPRFVEQIQSGGKIDDNLMYDVCLYLSISWMRTKKYRDEHIGHLHNQLIDSLKGWGGNIEDIKKTNQLGDEHVNAQHIMMLMDQDHVRGCANLFFAQRIRIYYTQGLEAHFVTSDNPIISIHPYKDSFYGTPFIDRIHYFALSPNILLEFSPHNGGKHIQRKLLKSNEEVTYYNSLRAMFSGYLYSDNEFSLDRELYDIVRSNNAEELYKLFGPKSEFKKDVDGIRELHQKYGKNKFKSNYDMLQYELKTLKKESNDLTHFMFKMGMK